jgi:hypothetical protein
MQMRKLILRMGQLELPATGTPATSDLHPSLALPYHSPGGQSLKHSSAVQTQQI